VLIAAKRGRTILPVAVAVLAAACGAARGPAAHAHPPEHRAPASSGAASLEERFGGIHQTGDALGSPRAPYTLFEFGDLQCPFCARFDRHVLPAVIQDFVRTGRVRLELHPVVFIGPDSGPGGAAAVAAGMQDHMWQFADLFYRNQQRENSGYVTAGFIDRVASAVPGLDVSALERARTGRPALAVMLRNTGLARAAAPIGTPDFRLGRTDGVLLPFVRGALSQGEFIRRLAAATGGDNPRSGHARG
jgi:hypothetical protein